jgi:DNA (cytosine-5)-methyltransferase 3A
MDRDEISKYLKMQPIELDSIELAPSKRRRLYWTNIPHPARLPRVKNHPSTFVQSFLLDGIALEEKTGVLTLALFLFFPFSKTKLSTSCSLSLSLTLLPLLQSFVFVSVGNLPSMP